MKHRTDGSARSSLEKLDDSLEPTNASVIATVADEGLA